MVETRLSRSEREAKLKDKAGWVVAIFAALLAINTYIGNANSSRILNDTLNINDTYNFYQAKSIKQSLAEGQMDDAIAVKNEKKTADLKAKIDRYESDPTTGEGKTQLLDKAHQLEADRNAAKERSPYFTFAGSALQISIVLLSAAILSVSVGLFWASVIVGGIGAILFGLGVFF
jgi:hypothetical protein